MINPFDKDWTKPAGHELCQASDAAWKEEKASPQSPDVKKVIEGTADALKGFDIFTNSHLGTAHYHPMSPASLSGYESIRTTIEIGGNKPPKITVINEEGKNYPTMEQEDRMQRLGVTDYQVLQIIREKHGIRMENLGKGEGGAQSLTELRAEVLDSLE